MTDQQARPRTHAGLDALAERSLLTSIWRRRTHRVSRGSSVDAGSMSWTSQEPRTPLTELEEAVLIALTGLHRADDAGPAVRRPARPQADHGQAQPEHGRSRGRQPGQRPGHALPADQRHRHLLPAQAASGRGRCLGARPGRPAGSRSSRPRCKLLDHRIDVPGGNRDFPAYLDSNRFLSNLPGTTILFPVVDLSRQYINALMYLLTQPEGARPTIVDDRNFYRMAGVKKWVEQRVPQQGDQAAARHPGLDADPDRGRPAAAEPDADRRRDGPGRLDPRDDRRRRCCWGTRSSASATARCWTSTGTSRSGGSPTSGAGRCRSRGTPTSGRTPSGCGVEEST